MTSDPRLACLVCGDDCRSGHPDAGLGSFGTIPMMDGLVFRATGNFGSTVFDPPDDQLLQVVVCDRCVRERADRVTYLTGDVVGRRQWPPKAD